MNSGERIGPYRLLRRLGRGGMGEVFEALHERIEQRVAIKLLADTTSSPRANGRMLAEARALAKLEHPGIVRILGCGELEDGTLYLVMEHLDGVSLRTWLCEQPGPVPLASGIDLVRQMAAAMSAVHKAGIVHRDLKPENILVLAAPERLGLGGAPLIKVLDFGIAKVPPRAPSMEDGHDTVLETGPSPPLGTVSYMAPEQVQHAAEVEGRADVYALGVVLYELLAGQPPFTGDPVAVLAAHLSAVPPPLGERRPEAPAWLCRLVEAMLAKDPTARPTMEEVGARLTERPDERPPECPFPGLRHFTPEQGHLFLGREAHIEEALRLIGATPGHGPGHRRWLHIEGPSGAGKSSLVQAGLVGRLRAAGSWHIASMRPGGSPLLNLAQALVHAWPGAGGGGCDVGELAESFERSPEALRHRARTVVSPDPDGERLLLVVDQLEEAFTIAGDEGGRFGELLARALADGDGPLHLITTLRSDLAHRLERLPALQQQLGQAARYHLRPLGETELRRALTGMVERSGLRLSEGLCERMVHDAASTDSPLPLVGHTLAALWYERQGQRLTHEGYEKMGGVGGAVAAYATALLDGLGAAGRERAKWMLLALVQIGRGGPDTRRPRTRAEVLAAAGGGGEAEEVLEQLSGRRDPLAPLQGFVPLRLVTITGAADVQPEAQRVELVHETLLRQVPTLAAWIEEERSLLERCLDLDVAAEAWRRAGRPTEGLPHDSLLEHYRGPKEEAARACIKRMTSELARHFIEAAEAQERRRRRQRGLVAALLGGAVMATMLSAGVAWRAEGHARHNAVEAREAQQQAEALLKSDFEASNDWVTDFDWKLAPLPHTFELRRKMQKHFEARLKLLPNEEQQSPAMELLLIKMHHRSGDQLLSHGLLADADKEFKEALRLIQRGLSKRPTDQDLQFLRALNLSKRGKVALWQGHLPEAETLFRQSVNLLEPTGSGRTASEDERRTFAVSCQELADSLFLQGTIQDAAAQYARAAGLFTRNRTKSLDRSLEAHALFMHGETLRLRGNREEAQREYATAHDLVVPLLREMPGNLAYQIALAETLYGMGLSHRDAGKTVLALNDFDVGAKLATRALAQDLGNKQYAQVLQQLLREHLRLARKTGAISLVEDLQRQCTGLLERFHRTDPGDLRFAEYGCDGGSGGTSSSPAH